MRKTNEARLNIKKLVQISLEIRKFANKHVTTDSWKCNQLKFIFCGSFRSFAQAIVNQYSNISVSTSSW